MRSATIVGHEIAGPAHVTADMHVSAALGIADPVEERFEDLDGTPVQLYNGPGRRIVPDRTPARVP